MIIKTNYDMAELGSLVSHIKGLIQDEIDAECPLDQASWTRMTGVLISVNDAKIIIDFIEGVTDAISSQKDAKVSNFDNHPQL